jgi:hypothetical protein
MAINDIHNDYTPHLQHKLTSQPTISALRTALSTFSSTTYTSAVLNGMTKRDMEYAARLNGLTVAGLD